MKIADTHSYSGLQLDSAYVSVGNDEEDGESRSEGSKDERSRGAALGKNFTGKFKFLFKNVPREGEQNEEVLQFEVGNKLYKEDNDNYRLMALMNPVKYTDLEEVECTCVCAPCECAKQSR